MKSKQDKKTPFWQSLLKGGLMLTFVGMVLIPPNAMLFGLATWMLAFFSGVAMVVVALGFGVGALVARYKAASAATAQEVEAESAPSTPV